LTGAGPHGEPPGSSAWPVDAAPPPASAAERDAWSKKPRLARRAGALTDRPIIRYLGRDDVEETAEGWREWTAVVAGWLREGRSPTVFVHTPDNADAPALARRFGVQAVPTLLILRDGEVAARQAGAAPLPALRSWVDGALGSDGGTAR